MNEEINELLEIVKKRENEEWERSQRMHEKYGRDAKLSELAVARWCQWNDFKYMLLTINEK